MLFFPPLKLKMAVRVVCILLLSVTFLVADSENHTEGGAELMLMLGPRVNERLTAIETLLTQHMRKLDLIDYKLTKIEVISQDKKNNDADKGVLVKKVEDLEWEIHKFGTLLEVLRADLDKVQQGQTELKILTSGNSRRKSDEGSNSSATDLSAKIQVMSGHLNALRRMNEVIQVHVQSHTVSLNNVTSISRELHSSSKQWLTKSYFQQSLSEGLDSRPRVQFNASPTKCVASRSEDEQSAAEDCSKWHQLGYNRSGVYQVRPKGSEDGFIVWCDMETDGGGWTVFQRRLDGSADFYQDWLTYKTGFGNIAGEHWLGNDKLHILTKSVVQRLRIEMEDMDNDKVSAEYSAFMVGSAASAYAMQLLGTYQGEAGDSFSYHVGMKFSTKDVDNDQWEGGSCSEDHRGGWWYKGCDMSNLNGLYLSGTTPEDQQYKGMYWYEWHGPAYSLQKSKMMIRPASYQPQPQTSQLIS